MIVWVLVRAIYGNLVLWSITVIGWVYDCMCNACLETSVKLWWSFADGKYGRGNRSMAVSLCGIYRFNILVVLMMLSYCWWWCALCGLDAVSAIIGGWFSFSYTAGLLFPSLLADFWEVWFLASMLGYAFKNVLQEVDVIQGMYILLLNIGYFTWIFCMLLSFMRHYIREGKKSFFSP